MAPTPSKPLIVIVGATGTGKSDLAIEIARRFDGEIINGDAMQLYRGLPIITNKITPEEMKSVPHHLIGCIGLEEKTWTVGRFVGEALRAMDVIRDRDKLPILVGGTHYYTQSLLFRDALSDEAALISADSIERLPILEEPTSIILAKLREVDPIMANRWHPNERRKIQRSLEIFLKTGKPASQIYGEQRLRRECSPKITDEESDTNTPGMRFPTLLLWVHANKDALNVRIDSRVDKMLKKGLLEEVEALTRFGQDYEASTSMSLDQSRGIWVSIGYKEFVDYQYALARQGLTMTEIEKLKSESIAKTQAATRQYANRQIKWIRIKLLNALIGAGQQDKVFLLDGSELSNWTDNVVQPALSLTREFLTGEVLPPPSSLSAIASEMLAPKRGYDLGQRPDLWQKRICDTCGTVAVTENDWNLHIKSRAHRRAVGIEKKQRCTEIIVEDREPSKAATSNVLESYVDIFSDSVTTE